MEEITTSRRRTSREKDEQLQERTQVSSSPATFIDNYTAAKDVIRGNPEKYTHVVQCCNISYQHCRENGYQAELLNKQPPLHYLDCSTHQAGYTHFHFKPFIKFMEKAAESAHSKVLIFSNKGQNFSCALYAAYMMKSTKRSAVDAISELQRMRPGCLTDENLIKQLKELNGQALL